VQAVTQALPLYHGVELMRPLLGGRAPEAMLVHVAVLAAYALGGYYAATVLTRRRLTK
jgi:lipooligosaccharide transport system permease protein